MTVTSDPPWPAALRAPIRALREVDESIYHIGWFVDDANSITAFGIGSNNKKKKKALQLAYALCMSGESAQGFTRNAPTLQVPRESEANVPSETDREEKEDAEAMKFIRAYFDGEEDTVDSVFEKIRGLLKVNRVVKEEIKEIKVPVGDLRFTQSSCSFYFRCLHRKFGDCPHGCPLRSTQDMTEDIVRGMDPSTQPWAVLTVVQLHGRLWSIDNRRLSAMKDAQKRIRETGGERVVWAKIRVFDFWPDEFQRFHKHLGHGAGPNDGKHIHVNRKRQLGLSAVYPETPKKTPRPKLEFNWSTASKFRRQMEPLHCNYMDWRSARISSDPTSIRGKHEKNKKLRVPISQPIAIDSKQAKTVLESAWKYLHTELSKLERKKKMARQAISSSPCKTRCGSIRLQHNFSMFLFGKFFMGEHSNFEILWIVSWN